jgi:hypothetical protein
MPTDHVEPKQKDLKLLIRLPTINKLRVGGASPSGERTIFTSIVQ